MQRLHLFSLLLAWALALSSLSSKAMGLAWFFLVLAGMGAAFQNRGRLFSNSDPTWAKTWLLVATSALLIKSIGVFYWSDSWGERHGEWRLFLGALALYPLLKFQALQRKTLSLLAHSLTISSAVGLIWVILHDRHAVPTHPIPWAGSMAMVSAWLLSLSLKSDFSPAHKRIWLTGGVLALMAVLSSQSRGAYGILLWWLAVVLHHLWPWRTLWHRQRTLKSHTPRLLAWLVATVLGLAALSQTSVFQRPAISLQDALSEIRVSLQSTSQGANSSVGARLYMWQNSLIAIQESPWLGYGRDTRKKFLLDWAEAAQSDEVKRLGHVHNEYLNQWLDHGLFGLSSQLLYLSGLIYMAWQLLRKNHHTAAWSLAGMAFMHMTSSLTNVNFSHNYYTASLSLFIGLSLWLSRLEPADHGH